MSLIPVCKLDWLAISSVIVLAAFGAIGAPTRSSEYLMDVWTSDDDLPDSSVSAIAQTPDGYLWVGTYNGLARFDGVRFVSFDPANTPALKHARVTGLFVDKEGTLWINTYDGSMTAWRHGVFTHEWEGGQVAAVFTRSNGVYFALVRGQLEWRGGNLAEHGGWESIELGGPAAGSCFREDGGGDLWYCLRDGRVGQVIGTNADLLSEEAGLRGEKVNYLTVDHKRRIWVGTERELALWNGRRFENQTPTNGESTLNTSFIYCTASNECWVFANGKARKCSDRRWVAEVESWRDLSQANALYLGAYEDQKGGVWFRQFGQGLFHVKPDGNAQRITLPNGLPGDRVSCWLEDREGNLWVGVDRGGLVRLREKRFQSIGVAEGLTNSAVSTICEDNDGSIWIGTFDGGLNRWRDGALQRFDLPGGTDRGFFFSAFPDSGGQLWLSAGKEDLYAFGKDAVFRSPGTAHGIKAILVDRQGRVWMGRQNGLSCWENGAITNFGASNGFARKDVRSLAEDRQGGIWFGTGDGGLYQWKSGFITAHPIRNIMQNQAVWSLLADEDGTLWIGTFRGGLLHGKDGHFSQYTTQSGLPSDIICQILDDGLGRLWMGSHKGIFTLSKNTLRDFDEGRIESLPCVSYGLSDGLPSLECSGNYQPSCWHGWDGRLWFATVKGAVSVRPDEVRVNRLPPPVVIEQMMVDGKALGGNGGGVAAQSGTPLETALRITPGEHEMEFSYTALSYAAPDKVRFRYKLEGLDDGWVEAGAKRSAQYGSLGPGDYCFRVVACNNDGVWNQQGAALGLRVLPHFWETWWCRSAAGLMVFGGIFGVARFVTTRNLRRKLEQLKQQQAVEADRSRIARDIHDDLGSGLTQIMLQSALAGREPEQTQTHLGQISSTARDLMRTMDEIVWAVNPENDTLDGLVTYLGKFAQEYLGVAGVRTRLDLPAQLPPHAVSAEARHSLFLAIKEVLHNVVKHSGATEVWFGLMVQPAHFTFVIQDNGRGFAAPSAVSAPGTDRVSSGHGLINLKNRLDLLGGRCTIKSSPGEGTRVELTAPASKEQRVRGDDGE